MGWDLRGHAPIEGSGRFGHELTAMLTTSPPGDLIGPFLSFWFTCGRRLLPIYLYLQKMEDLT